MFLIILKIEKCVSMQLKIYYIDYDMFLINKIQKMCDEAILENGGTLKSVPNLHKSQEMSNKAVDNYSHTVEVLPKCYKTQEMSDKAVDTDPTTLKYVPQRCKNQEVCSAVKQFIDAFCIYLCSWSIYNSRNKWQSYFWRSSFNKICSRSV